MPRRRSASDPSTIVDVARRSGVSLGTVSRVINGNASVSDVLRKRVEAAASALGYAPNPAAQRMRGRAAHAVGLMVTDVANPMVSATVSAAEAVLHAAGYQMILANSRGSVDNEKEILQLFHRRRFDGMIVTLAREDDPEINRLLVTSGMPVVLYERSSARPLHSVSTDHYGGVHQATKYLLGLGHQRIGLVTVTQGTLPGRARGLAYAAAHKEAGIAIDPALQSYDGFEPDAGYKAAYRMLASAAPPTAILAGANQMPGVLKAVRALKLTVPRKLSLVQIGDTDVAVLHQPPLTVVRWDFAKVGASAAEVLLARIAGRVEGPRCVVLPTELVVRQSCAPPG